MSLSVSKSILSDWLFSLPSSSSFSGLRTIVCNHPLSHPRYRWRQLTDIFESVKILNDSSMVSTNHFSLHENVNERGTSNPPE